MTGVLVLVVTLVVATVAGLVFQARNGRMRVTAASATDSTATDSTASDTTTDSTSVGAAPGIDLRPFDGEPGERATLLQFSSSFCAPCRATRTMLGEVAGIVPGVRHVEIDVADGEAAMDLVRRLDIRRTPTTLILDQRGHEIRRASGVPRRDQVLAALGELEPEAGPATAAAER